ncbi:MAG: hypothetical protein M5U01_09015 [Ardenticatenaceae bacterium]|nr:hypothetical protein [Ardenticatenaceae bacterium]
MSVIESWSIKLAQEVAPDEVDLAPLMAEAFRTGGKAREELFQSSGGTVGAFAPGDVISVMPPLYQSMFAVAPIFIAVLSSDAVKGCLDAVKNALTVIELRMKAEKLAPGPAETTVKPAVPPGDAYAPLRRVIDTMRGELQSSGLSAEKADVITLRALKALLEEPQGATQFVQQLSESR